MSIWKGSSGREAAAGTSVASLWARVAARISPKMRLIIVPGVFEGRASLFGTATIATGTTSVVVNHGFTVAGVAAAPTPDQIHITPTNSPTNAPGHWWVDTITTTQFTLHCAANPGASGFTAGWSVVPV